MTIPDYSLTVAEGQAKIHRYTVYTVHRWLLLYINLKQAR